MRALVSVIVCPLQARHAQKKRFVSRPLGHPTGNEQSPRCGGSRRTRVHMGALHSYRFAAGPTGVVSAAAGHPCRPGFPAESAQCPSSSVSWPSRQASDVEPWPCSAELSPQRLPHAAASLWLVARTDVIHEALRLAHLHTPALPPSHDGTAYCAWQ
ncbi:uncharacterized protein C8Q71DRAFT_75691 [Rhodofomes roseus]|uniref:Uncharacterized protein n=1 Tax=Rhodofomes roseus TaxID=34475 RepID=A0ABQ8KFJ2_9APHY|nr:uncharacterized protein C8Q71DRAFT_75691 [Rhodofomes roseus]KAH9836285.1 hypothetical protein C8Q71DRAFT_75691 [Rhodofomes roseus]